VDACDFARKCAGWTDAHLLAEYEAGPRAYADPDLRQIMRAEVVRRGLKEQAANKAPGAAASLFNPGHRPSGAGQMTVQPCRSCGQVVSTEALTCPHCGAPKPTAAAREKDRAGKQTITIGSLVVGAAFVLFIIVLASVTGTSKSPSTTAARPTSPPWVQLASVEEGTLNPDPHTVEDFRQALLRLDSACTDHDPAKVAGFVFAAHDDLRKAGIPVTIRRLMSEMNVLRELAPGFNATCAELSAYVQTRHLLRQQIR